MKDSEEIPDVADLRLIPVALAAWCGAWWGTGGGRAPLFLFLLSFLMAVCAFLLFNLRRPLPSPLHARNPQGSLRAGLLVLALTIAVSTSIAGAQRQAFDASETVKAAHSSALVSLKVRLEEDPIPIASRSGVSRSRARAQVRETGEGRAETTYVRIVVTGENLNKARRGDDVQLRGLIDPSFPQGPPTAGLLKDDRVVIVARPQGWQRWVRELRERLVQACAGLTEQGRALVPGMAIGDDRAMGPELRRAFRTASLSHLTAVSGSHLAIVLGVAPYLLPKSRRGRIFGMGIVLLGFVALVGPTPAVLRAVLSSGSALLGALIGRNGQGVATLGAVVLGMLLLDPWCSRDFGFALSCAATFGVLIPARICVRSGLSRLREDSVFGRFLARLLAVIAVPACCAMMTAPILLMMQPGLPLYAVLANLVAAPAVAPATLLALGTTLLAPLWMPGAVMLAHLSSVCTAWIATTARVIADLPGASFEPGSAVSLLFAVLTAACIFFLIWKYRRSRELTSTQKNSKKAKPHARTSSFSSSSTWGRTENLCVSSENIRPHSESL